MRSFSSRIASWMSLTWMPAVGRYAPAPASFRLPSIFGSSHVPLTRRSASSSPRLSWMNPGKSEVRSPFSRTCPVERCLERPLAVEGGREARRDRQLETPPGLPILRQRQGSGAANRLSPPLPGEGSGAQARRSSPLRASASRTFPPERAASPFSANRCSGRRFPVARPARRPSRLTARGSQGRKSNRSMPAHSRFTSPSPGMASPAGFGEEKRPFRLPPPASERSMFACMPRSFPSMLSDPCSTPMGRPSRVRTPEAPTRPATTSRPAPISAAEAGSAPCQPQVSSAVWRSAASASPPFCQRTFPPARAIPPREVEPFTGEEFPRDPPREASVEADVAGQPAAEQRQVDPRPFSRSFHRFRDGQPGGCRRRQGPFQHSPAGQVELHPGAHPLLPSVEAERALLHGDAVLLRRQGSPRAGAPRHLGPPALRGSAAGCRRRSRP